MLIFWDTVDQVSRQYIDHKVINLLVERLNLFLKLSNSLKQNLDDNFNTKEKKRKVKKRFTPRLVDVQ